MNILNIKNMLVTDQIKAELTLSRLVNTNFPQIDSVGIA